MCCRSLTLLQHGLSPLPPEPFVALGVGLEVLLSVNGSGDHAWMAPEEFVLIVMLVDTEKKFVGAIFIYFLECDDISF